MERDDINNLLYSLKRIADSMEIVVGIWRDLQDMQKEIMDDHKRMAVEQAMTKSPQEA